MSSLTALIVLITLIHVAALAIMIVIRVRRNEVEGTAGKSALILHRPRPLPAAVRGSLTAVPTA